MTPPPSHISNKPLPDFVYALPDNMAPQPSLTRFWCRNSITRLTTQSKKDPDGTTSSFIRVFRRPQGYATRKNNFGVCSSCGEAKEGGCVEVEPHFRRAANMLDFLIDRALRKTNEETTRRGDNATDDEVISATQTYWQTAFDYAKACRQGFVDYDAVERRKVKESGLSEVEYYKARQASREHNLERFNAALGTVGQKAPANAVIDKDIEEHFKKHGRAAHAEKRWYYYGTDIPSATDAPVAPFARMSLSQSPTKPSAPRRQDSPEFEPSPTREG